MKPIDKKVPQAGVENEIRNVADIIFDGHHAGGQVMRVIDSLLGEEEDYFVNCWFYFYDSSIEILFKTGFRGLTREEADAILELGFSIIYESIGNEGIMWTEKQRVPCHAKQSDEESRLLFKYKRALMKLMPQAALKNEI